jgi:hypothetical protein
MKHYFKRYWDELSDEDLTNSWGTSTYYFETDEKMIVTRQIQIFDRGQILKYHPNFREDEFGMLSDQKLNMEDFEDFGISEEEFKNV